MSRNEWMGYGFALGAGVCYGLNNVLVRQGLVAFQYPLLGASIALAAGTLALLLASLPQLGTITASQRTSFAVLLLAGLASSVGVACNYSALSLAPVAVVSPIGATFPLVTLLVTRLFLSHRETVTWRMALGALLVVAGVTVITLSRTVDGH